MKNTILTFSVTLSIVIGSLAQPTSNPLTNRNEMIYQDMYSVFVTKDLKVCKEFYGKWFNFQVAFESSFFILFVSRGEKSFSIGFISEDHPSSPPYMPGYEFASRRIPYSAG